MKPFPHHRSNWFRQVVAAVAGILRLVALAADLGLVRWISEQFDGSDLG